MNFIMVERIVKVRDALDQMVIDPDWHIFVAGLQSSNGLAWNKTISVRTYICADGFWDSCDIFLHMVTTVVKTLRAFDGKQPAMGFAWKEMYELKNIVIRFAEEPYQLEASLVEKALDALNASWALMRNDLHVAGGMLNPYLRGWAPLHEADGHRNKLNNVLQKLASMGHDFLCIIR